MSVRAKVFVQTLTTHAGQQGGVNVTLSAASKGEENAVWAQWTPSLNLTMFVKKGPAADFFSEHLGQELYLDFTSAESAE